MALLPYLVDYELNPRRLRDQLFGATSTLDDLLSDVFDRPIPRYRNYIRPWRKLIPRERFASTIKADRDKFQINLDVQHFSPDEVSVKTCDGYIVIEGSHEEKKDDHGFVSRSFKRRYALPEGCSPELVQSRLSSDGVLTVEAPREGLAPGERVVPITHTGPIRRKHTEEGEDQEQIQNGGSEPEEKAPQKKKKR
ncbi:Protein lethal(2)essential for life [Eumeta japonica]|uniref:Protein lethal(2)essential for life n=1 Tax=Eumeta variegata TaxID=151549 RepID=A0A4C1STY8_EUMVA|nr:Protein lethal(2)essential for life [Eumeta japonica]